MRKTELKLVASTAADERTVLAEALRLKDEAEAGLQKATAELAAFDETLRETSHRAYLADKALGEAREALNDALRQHAGDETNAVASALLQGRLPPRETLEKAEKEYIKSEEALRLGKEGRHGVAGAKIAADDILRSAVEKVRKAVEAVCHTRLPALLAEAEKAQALYLAKRSALMNVARHYDGVTSNYNVTTDELAQRIRAFLTSSYPADYDRLAKPWDDARAALCTDPDAVLPE